MGESDRRLADRLGLIQGIDSGRMREAGAADSGFRQVFSRLLDRFWRGIDYRTRPVKISDLGRIRNELQTWCSEVLEYFGEDGIRLSLDTVDDAVIPADEPCFILEVLSRDKESHPEWFRRLEIA